MKHAITKVPVFSTKEVSGVTFGGFAASNRLCSSSDKILYRGKTLPQAMILAADKGNGFHLTTSFEWASMAYLWQKAKTIEDCAIDLHEETWQWVMGLFMHQDGHVDVLANLDVTYAGSPYGRGTIKKSGDENQTIVCDGKGLNWQKKWIPGSFDGMSVYIAEADNGAGKFYQIIHTTEKSISISAKDIPSPSTATFCILRHVAVDVTVGMSFGDRITSLRESDDDLKPFAIPGSSDDEGKAEFGFDNFWFYKCTVRAARRGGYFNGGGGAFSLYLSYAPSSASYDIGFRACKALKSENLNI